MIETPQKEIHCLFCLTCFIVSNCPSQLIFYKKEKCMKQIHLITDDGLDGNKVLSKKKNCFCFFFVNDAKFFRISCPAHHTSLKLALML